MHSFCSLLFSLKDVMKVILSQYIIFSVFIYFVLFICLWLPSLLVLIRAYVTSFPPVDTQMACNFLFLKICFND